MKKYSKEEIEIRIAKLKTKPIENARLIAKWKRMERRIKDYDMTCA